VRGRDVIRVPSYQRRASGCIIVSREPGDPTETVARILRLAYADYRQPGAKLGVRIDIALWAEALHERRIAKLLAASAAAALEAIAGALAEAEGVKPRNRHTTRARLIGALIVGVAVQWHADPSFEPASLAAATVALAPALAEATS
jgi:hypothetical protein